VLKTNGAVRVRNTYDYMGRRVKKIVDAWDTGLNVFVPQETLTFVYDGWLLVQELSDQAPEAVTGTAGRNFEFFWGIDKQNGLQGLGGVGNFLSQISYTSNGSLSSVVMYDANDNIKHLVSAMSGFNLHVRYDAFGKDLDSTSPQKCRLGFSTKYYDKETSQLYYGYRFYSLANGRWLNRDMSGEAGGLNLFAFDRNSMVNYTDYLGLFLGGNPFSGSYWSDPYAWWNVLGHVSGAEIAGNMVTEATNTAGAVGTFAHDVGALAQTPISEIASSMADGISDAHDGRIEHAEQLAVQIAGEGEEFGLGTAIQAATWGTLEDVFACPITSTGEVIMGSDMSGNSLSNDERWDQGSSAVLQWGLAATQVVGGAMALNRLNALPGTLSFSNITSLNAAANAARRFSRYRYGGFEWRTDGRGRVSRFQGEITQRGQDVRHIHEPGLSGTDIGREGTALPDDIGFHIGGNQFGCPVNRLNIVPGNGGPRGSHGLNGSAYSNIERVISNAVRDRQSVDLDVRVRYSDGSNRPSRFDVRVTVDGQSASYSLENTSGRIIPQAQIREDLGM